LVRNPERKSHLENIGIDGSNIRMDLREIRWEVMDWMFLT
jgi:hypothetical protein